MAKKGKVHFKIDREYTACGLVAMPNDTKNVNNVTCGNCMNKRIYKEAYEEYWEEKKKKFLDAPIGSTFKVTRPNTDKNFKFLDGYVGQFGELDCEIDEIEDGIPLTLDDSYLFPHQMLELVATPDQTVEINEDDLSFENGPMVEESTDGVCRKDNQISANIGHTILDDLWSVMCGAENNFEYGYQCISFYPEKGFAIFSELKDKSPKVFKVAVQEMELVEKSKNG